MVGVPPTAGVGCSRRASSSAVGAGARRWPRNGVARWATWPNTATSGTAADLEVAAHLAERVGDGVDDEAVLPLVLHRLGQGAERCRVAVGDGGAGHRPRLDGVAHAADEELGAGADDAVGRVDEAPGLLRGEAPDHGTRASNGASASTTHLACEHDLLDVAVGDRGERAARPSRSTVRACAARRS